MSKDLYTGKWSNFTTIKAPRVWWRQWILKHIWVPTGWRWAYHVGKYRP